jgi:hypothetical protein
VPHNIIKLVNEARFPNGRVIAHVTCPDYHFATL